MLNDKNIYELLINQKKVDGNYTDLFNNKINDANKKETEASKAVETAAEAAKKAKKKETEASKAVETAAKQAEEAAKAAEKAKEKTKKISAYVAKNKKYIKSVNNYNDAVNNYLKAINKQKDAENKHNDAKNIKTIITLITEYYNKILFKNIISGGAIMDSKKSPVDIKKIIEILKDNIDKLEKINKNIEGNNKVDKEKYKVEIDKLKFTPSNNVNDLLKKEEEVDSAFKKYSDIILDDINNIKILKDNLKNIESYYIEISSNLKKIDKDDLLKKNVEDLLNNYQIKDLDITSNIEELEDITTTKYKANKEYYEKIKAKYIGTINSLNKQNEFGEVNKLIEEIKKKKGGDSSFSGGEEPPRKSLEDLIKLLNSIKRILETGINKSSNNSNSNSNLNKDPSQFEKIWNSYNKYLTDIKLENDEKKGKTEMDANDYLYDQVEVNDLNPIIALQLTDNDKYVFCGLTYFIRLSIVIILDLLINYNILKKLEHALIIFIFMYVSILALITAVVNYDTYKLRILLNYFNMNMNTSKLLLHVFLVVIFYILILIIIFNNTDKTNDTNDVEFINVLDFTYIYNYIFDILDNNKTLKPKNINLTQKEKLKLLYRVEILTMIVYIFSSFIILMV